MTATTISIILGSLIFLFAGAVMILNILCLFVIWKSGLTKQNNIYFLAFSNMLGQAMHMFLIAFYLGPTSVLQDFLFPGGMYDFGTKAISFIFLGLWYQEMLLQIVISVNRMVSIVFPVRATFFTRNVMIALAIGSFVVAYFMATIAHLILPCCRVYIYYGDYSYAYLDHEFNYVDWFIDLPLNFSSSTIALICYGIIFVYILSANRKIAGQVQKDAANKRKAKEVRYALQFAATTLFILFVWVNFRLFPIVVPAVMPLYSTIVFAVIIHCSINGVVFLTINNEFQQHFQIVILRRKTQTNGTIWAKTNNTNVSKIAKSKCTNTAMYDNLDA